VTDPLLSIRGLTVRYGAVTAVHGVDCTVERGELVGIIGPNGAGKTSLIDALTGFTEATGSARFKNVELLGLASYKRARSGVGRTFQGVELFEDLTVRENLMIAAERSRWQDTLRRLRRPHRAASRELLEDTLATFGLSEMADRRPTELSQGRRKMVGVARALIGQPELLLLDEPAAGLDSAESRVFGDRLRRLVADGLSAVLIDHDVDLVMGICDRMYVLEFGEVIASGPAAEIRANDRVIKAYLGTGGHDAR
jgi:branched-chain amino acid transport system ATP-binding protein